MCRLPPLLPDSRHNLVVHCLMDYRLSIEVFCRIVRALGISADRVVYPEDEVEESEEVQLVRLIRACDVRDRAAIKAMVEALLYSREETSRAGEANACAV